MPSLTSFMMESGGSEWGLSILRVGVGRDAAEGFFLDGLIYSMGVGGEARLESWALPHPRTPIDAIFNDFMRAGDVLRDGGGAWAGCGDGGGGGAAVVAAGA